MSSALEARLPELYVSFGQTTYGTVQTFRVERWSAAQVYTLGG